MTNSLPSFTASAPRAESAPATSTPVTPFAPAANATPATPAEMQTFQGAALRLGDPLAGLPPAARDKFLAISDATNDAYALSRGPRADIDAARERVEELTGHLSRHEAVAPRFQNGAEIARLRAALDSARAERDRHQARYDKAIAAWQPLKRVYDTLNNYISNSGACTQAEPVEVPQIEGKSPVQMLETARAVVVELKSERKQIVAAPNPSSHAKAAAREFVDRFAKEGEPPIELLLETNRPLTLRGGFDNMTSTPILQNFLFWLCRDEIVKKLDKLIAENAEDDNALTAEERRERLRDIDAKILQAERIEEEIVVACLSAGAHVDRRGDMDPRAVLGICGPTPRD